MKKLALAITALLCALTAPALAQSPPLELKEIRIGESTLADVTARFPGVHLVDKSVLVSPQGYVDKLCGYVHISPNPACRSKAHDDVNVAGASPGTYWFHDLDGKIEGINVTFSKSGFTTVRDALIIKYGEPTEKKAEEWKNRAGASFQSQALTWARPDGEIRISELGGRIDESRLTIYSNKYKTRAAEDAKKRAQDGAKKL